MRNIAKMTLPMLLSLLGVYMLSTMLSSSGGHVTLVNGHNVPSGLVLIIGLLMLGSGATIMFNAWSARKPSPA